MIEMRITRISSSQKCGTFSAVTIEGEPFSVALEEYWRFNEPYISCIPTGMYICKRYSSEKHPNTFEVTNVEGRSFILFHVGNTNDNSSGCILLGSRYGVLNGKNAILDSSTVFEKFLNAMSGEDEFRLVIKESF